MRYLYIVIMVALSGCAADVGKNNTADLQNENTSLKVQIAQLNVDKKQALESAASSQQALNACFKAKP